MKNEGYIRRQLEASRQDMEHLTPADDKRIRLKRLARTWDIIITNRVKAHGVEYTAEIFGLERATVASFVEAA